MTVAPIPAETNRTTREDGLFDVGYILGSTHEVHRGYGSLRTPMATDESRERRRVIFGGRVQGVGFRATARSVARSCEVTGWVRNEADGSVLLEVQGRGGAVQGFLAALREKMGKLIASESSVLATIEPGESGFEVRY
jgi:acylphosphatase